MTFQVGTRVQTVGEAGTTDDQGFEPGLLGTVTGNVAEYTRVLFDGLNSTCKECQGGYLMLDDEIERQAALGDGSG